MNNAMHSSIFIMFWWLTFLFVSQQYVNVLGDCSMPAKFFVDCGTRRSLIDAIGYCTDHGMTLVNLMNSSGTLMNDIDILNQTFLAKNCIGDFWFSSGNQTGLVIDIIKLADLATALISGVVNLLLCLTPLLCSTMAPVTSALTVCARSIQTGVMQKCADNISRMELKTFQFTVKTMRAGLLNSFHASSVTECSGECASNSTCIGIAYTNGMCQLYM
jgi:hypothetical protein